jgi:hypothetical protein
MSDRDRDHEDDMSLQVDESSGPAVGDAPPSATPTVGSSGAQQDIDLLFGTQHEITIWEPPRPPPALGELLDSRYMFPLLFPSDPRMLATVSVDRVSVEKQIKRRSAQLSDALGPDSVGNRTVFQWRSRNRKVREVGVEALRLVDGNRPVAQWMGPFEGPQDDQDDPPPYTSDDPDAEETTWSGISQNHSTPLTRKPSTRSKGRQSSAGAAPINP